MMEYMVQASNPELQKFKAEQMRVVPHIRTWQPTLAVYDPARTVKKETSSMTGHVVASWIGTKLVIWEGDGRFLMPDEMIKDLFRVDENTARSRLAWSIPALTSGSCSRCDTSRRGGA
jgi:hypothetical protein